MTSHSFDFPDGIATGYSHGTVSLMLMNGDASFNLRGLSPTRARDMAEALYQAAHAAEQPAVATGEAA